MNGKFTFHINRFLRVFSVELRNGKQSNKKWKYARAAENKNDNDKRVRKHVVNKKQHWNIFSNRIVKESSSRKTWKRVQKFKKELPVKMAWRKRKQFAKQAPKLLTALLVYYIIGIYGTCSEPIKIKFSCDVTKQIMPKNIHGENTRAGSCLHTSFVRFVADQWDR